MTTFPPLSKRSEHTLRREHLTITPTGFATVTGLGDGGGRAEKPSGTARKLRFGLWEPIPMLPVWSKRDQELERKNSDLVTAKKRIEAISLEDPLTKLPNRRYMERFAQKRCCRRRS